MYEKIMHNVLFPFSAENLECYLKKSKTGDYLLRYLNELDAKTCIIEERYIDKDYMIDYQKFYSRSFEKYTRETTRIHIFDKEISEKEFKKALNGKYKQLIKSYLGFIIVKPVFFDIDKEEPLIGRTLLKTYLKEEGNLKRYFIREKYHVSLFGIPLDIESLPFQDQDIGVGMCATIALWVASQPLVNPYGIPKLSPAEITEIATLQPTPNRRFPSVSGLDVNQMVNYIQSVGLDVEPIEAHEEIIPIAVKAYINARLPLIALVALYKNGENEEDYDWHAAVISGYKCDEKRNIKELYVHDDAIGPYNKVKSMNGNFKFWDNEWIRKEDYDKCEVYDLLVPVYSKIRLTFFAIFSVLEEKNTQVKSSEIAHELYLYTIRKYKKELLGARIEDKMEILKMFLPRFLWVIRTYYKNEPFRDDIYDGTSVYARHCKTVNYR
ncbi:MAG: hypothetical protein EFT35_07990 [Methanophagales archaeon ANME-1-THS]|nr:MAG: hypothetical protein EFT35_07990 [Methanophagales archaeon ANME-1-THS]